jgi:hypothetical protein
VLAGRCTAHDVIGLGRGINNRQNRKRARKREKADTVSPEDRGHRKGAARRS